MQKNELMENQLNLKFLENENHNFIIKDAMIFHLNRIITFLPRIFMTK